MKKNSIARPASSAPRTAPFTVLQRFTLIELLTVLAIIAILIAMLLPGLSRAKGTAISVVCKSNLKQQFIAISVYALDNDNLIPPSGEHFRHAGVNYYSGAWWGWIGAAGYMGAPELWDGPITETGVMRRYELMKCPAEAGSSGNAPGIGTGMKYFDSDRNVSSYQINASVGNRGCVNAHSWWVDDLPGAPGGIDWWQKGVNDPLGEPYELEQYFRRGFLQGPSDDTACNEVVEPMASGPSDAIFVMDCGEEIGNSVWIWTMQYFTSTEIDSYQLDRDTTYAYRHPGDTANAYYMDGHVAQFRPFWLSGERNFRLLWRDTGP
jgi:prepilin-type N-terminal cleavage/methylation domain-containing protein/prepilin-type processing-associated H-X9-DG protein